MPQPEPKMYRHYLIEPVPGIPTMYLYYHQDYDGAPERIGEGPADERSGTGTSEDDCKEKAY